MNVVVDAFTPCTTGRKALGSIVDVGHSTGARDAMFALRTFKCKHSASSVSRLAFYILSSLGIDTAGLSPYTSMVSLAHVRRKRP